MFRLQGLAGVLLVMVAATSLVWLWQRDGASSTTSPGTPSANVTPSPTATSPERTPTPAPTSTPEPLATPKLDVAGSFAFDQTDRLVTSGIGLVFFGDLLDDAGSKAGTTWADVPTGAKPTCYTVTPTGGPPGLEFTVVNGRIERVDVTTEIITTPSGARVGMSEADLLSLFGESLTTQSTDAGTRVEFQANDEADQEFRIVWQTDGTTVVSMRGGRLPHVTPDTACAS